MTSHHFALFSPLSRGESNNNLINATSPTINSCKKSKSPLSRNNEKSPYETISILAINCRVFFRNFLSRSTQYQVIPIILIFALLIFMTFRLPDLFDVHQVSQHMKARKRVSYSSTASNNFVQTPTKAPLQWEAMPGLTNRSDVFISAADPIYREFLSERLRNKPLASQMLGGQPVYVSLTTINSRIYGLADTVQSIIDGAVLPDHIYIFVSKTPYLLDEGVSVEFLLAKCGRLKTLALDYPYLSIIFTENIGPHRKLLPLLSQKWKEDCVIITIDDHEIYPKGMLSSLIEYYEATDRVAVVALRSRRMGLCSEAPPWRVSHYTDSTGRGIWPEANPERMEMLTLPTGTGGVLYRPQFFHPIIFDRYFLNLTRTADDLMFRLSSMAKGTRVVTACLRERHRCASPDKVKFVSTLKAIIPNSMLEASENAESTMLINPLFASPPSYIASRNGRDAVNKFYASESNRLASQALSSLPVDGEAKTQPTLMPNDLEYNRNTNEKLNSNPNLDPPALYHINQEVFMFNHSRNNDPLIEYRKSIRLDILNEMSFIHLRNRHHHHRKLDSTQGSNSKGDSNSKDGTDRLNSMTFSMDSKTIIEGNLINNVHSSSRRSLRWFGLQSDPPKDPRKQVSLASKYNVNGTIGNNAIWDQAVRYLKGRGVFDFEFLVQTFAPLERNTCLYSTDVIRSPTQLRSVYMPQWLQDIIHSWKVRYQNFHNHECGINICVR